MKTVIIHGQSHKGSTCHVARLLAGKVGGELTEFFLPRDFGEFCVGCTSCFVKSEACCSHHEKLRPIREAMDEADLIILASPVYVYHATGAMKAFWTTSATDGWSTGLRGKCSENRQCVFPPPPGRG